MKNKFEKSEAIEKYGSLTEKGFIDKISSSEELKSVEGILRCQDLLEFDLSLPIDAQVNLFETKSEIFCPKFFNFSPAKAPDPDFLQRLNNKKPDS